MKKGIHGDNPNTHDISTLLMCGKRADAIDYLKSLEAQTDLIESNKATDR